MPGADRQRHHQQLGDDQRRVRYSHDVQEFSFKQHKGAIHNYATLIDTD